MKFNIYNSLILAGAVQGLIFSIVVLLSNKYQNRSIYFLTALIASFSLSIFQYYLADTRLVSFDTLYNVLFIPYAPLNPVLFYLYVFTSLYPNHRISLSQKRLFIPFLFFLFVSLFFKAGCVLHWDSVPFKSVFWYLFVFHEVFSLVFTVFLGYKSYSLICNYEKQIVMEKEKHIVRHFNWLKNTLVIAGILCLFWAYLTYELLIGRQTSFYFLWIGMSFTIYWLGHVGIYKFGIYEERNSIRTLAADKVYAKITRYKVKSEHICKMEDLMINQKYYLDNDITLERIANKLDINKSHLSRLISAELHTGFIDYINQLRVEEAKVYLADPEFSNYTLVAIGLESGFNSKSAFNNAFKKHTGITPSEYKKNKQST